ncbi:uncharacterized protein LOC134339944 isoform X2 [Mobula hypostoma]|uniref:uncharacterized protein LOC134339944 isoform X2 n=1 Tax=Mobula hypostoma TaxID=723540 RepID=UPI002FC32FF8
MRGMDKFHSGNGVACIRGFNSAQYSFKLRVTMLPMFLLFYSLVVQADLTESHCLGYDVLHTTANYQLRRYNESVWVGTHEDFSFTHRVETYRRLLRRYTNGENSAGLRTRSSDQFLTSFTRDRGIAMYLMLTEEVWDNPATPTNPRAFIKRFPGMDVFAKRIHRDLTTEASDFNRTLTEQNAKFNNSFFFVSSCLRHHHIAHKAGGKEIWFVATGGLDFPLQ